MLSLFDRRVSLILVLCPASGVSLAASCDSYLDLIRRIDRGISSEPSAEMRQLRLQERSNYVQTYNLCRSQQGRAGGPGVGGGGYPAGNSVMPALDALNQGLGLLRDLALEAEQRQAQEAARAQMQRRLLEEEQEMLAAQRAAEEQEARRRDLERLRAMDNPFTTNTPARANPFDVATAEPSSRSIEDSASRDRQPAAIRPSNTPADKPRADTSARTLPAGVKSNEQIARECSTAANASMCRLMAENARSENPAYRQWLRQQQASLDRSIGDAQAEVDRQFAAARAGQTGAQSPGRSRTPSPSVATAPVPPRPGAAPAKPEPRAGIDPELAKCREGASQPETVLGCYELRAGKPRAESLKELLRRRLAQLRYTGSAAPSQAYPPLDEWEQIVAQAEPPPNPASAPPPPREAFSMLGSDTDAAIRDLVASVANDPGQLERNRFADESARLLQKGDAEVVRRNAGSVLAGNAKDTNARYFLAEAYRSLGNVALARQHYRLVIEHAPNSSEAMAAERRLQQLDEQSRLGNAARSRIP